jgi:D-xylose 1-dehydrogenase (NADP+, D-xylono-1,5-lactone-forming)
VSDPTSSAPLRLGLLSTARINDAILSAARDTDRVEVVAVGSRDRARAEEYARGQGIARAHGSYEHLFEDEEVDAVYVSLPNGLHHEWTVAALGHGKHVLCEKPYSRRPAEVEEAFAHAESAGLVLMEAFMFRHHPQTAAVQALVDDGAVGRMRLVRSVFSFVLPDSGDIRASAELDGGALMDVGCYCVSGSRLLAGEPARVAGERVDGPTGIDLSLHATMRFPDDVVAQFDCSFALPRRQSLEVVGEEGRLVVESPWRTDWPGDVLLERGDGVQRVDVPGGDAYRFQLENLADAVEGKAPALLGRADALGQARVLDALYRSAAEGRSIALA